MRAWKPFSEVSEKDVSNAIIESFSRHLREYTNSDVIVVGGGPSGLMAAKRLSEKGKKVLLIERNNYLGGGFWIGGYLMNKVTLRDPSHEYLDELGVPYEQAMEGLYVADGPHACSSLIKAACDAGVRIANMTVLEDLILRGGTQVNGAAINWAPVFELPDQITCLDPIAIESELVIDATGHDSAAVKKLVKRGLIEWPGNQGMDVRRAEDLVLEKTGEIFPGLIVTGMAVAEAYGLPRMGPTFGAMMASGDKAAQEAERLLAKLAA